MAPEYALDSVAIITDFPSFREYVGGDFCFPTGFCSAGLWL